MKNPQTSTIIAVLSLASNFASEIAQLRADNIKANNVYCDISYAALQAIRLYMANYYDKEFKISRLALRYELIMR